MQCPRQTAVADDADRLVIEHECADIAMPQVFLLAAAHKSVADGDVAGGRDGHAQRELRYLAGESGRGAQHADAPFVTFFIVQRPRESASHIHDGAEFMRLRQDIAVPPARADNRDGIGQRAQKLVRWHGRVMPPDDIDQLVHALSVFWRKELVHAAEMRVDDDFGFHGNLPLSTACRGESLARPLEIPIWHNRDSAPKQKCTFAALGFGVAIHI